MMYQFSADGLSFANAHHAANFDAWSRVRTGASSVGFG